MSTEAISCNQCGAGIDVPESAKYATCRHCGSRLAIKRTLTATYSELLEELEQRTDRLEDRVDALAHGSELEELDRAWERQRGQYMITNKQGIAEVPTKTGSTIGGVVIAGFGTIWTLVACGIGGAFQAAPGPFPIVGLLFPLFGVVFVAGGIAMTMHSYRQAERYERAYNRYLQKRKSILEQQGKIGEDWD
ncbi:hypothetical protein [Calycomorphotria hydatis]|uniref:Uncharacterized protein n=1 Tax=Calycomorphotria hydatis TaxID=2528027 RepID=A0A517T558_9PLAN|nr:hypothetical protein [Calycomorphotria hydatis]QDT63471.1 hypothetical protein V22_06930 [Calycomorphotria hydatis]